MIVLRGSMPGHIDLARRIAGLTVISIVASVILTSVMVVLFVGLDATRTFSASQLWRISLSISMTAPALVGPIVAFRMSKVIQDLRTTHDEAVKLSKKDTLTGLLNRRGFDEAAALALAEARPTGQPITALMCDIDMFKAINDEHGHDCGDIALREVAQMMQASFAGRAAVLGRQGGDEFAILLPGVDVEEASRIAEGLREDCEAHSFVRQGRAPRVTLSVGIATECSGEAQLQTLMSRADAALLQAKRGGRNLVVPNASILALQGQLERRETTSPMAVSSPADERDEDRTSPSTPHALAQVRRRRATSVRNFTVGCHVGTG